MVAFWIGVLFPLLLTNIVQEFSPFVGRTRFKLFKSFLHSHKEREAPRETYFLIRRFLLKDSSAVAGNA